MRALARGLRDWSRRVRDIFAKGATRFCRLLPLAGRWSSIILTAPLHSGKTGNSLALFWSSLLPLVQHFVRERRLSRTVTNSARYGAEGNEPIREIRLHGTIHGFTEVNRKGDGCPRMMEYCRKGLGTLTASTDVSAAVVRLLPGEDEGATR